jgi:hypothetical protein
LTIRRQPDNERRVGERAKLQADSRAARGSHARNTRFTNLQILPLQSFQQRLDALGLVGETGGQAMTDRATARNRLSLGDAARGDDSFSGRGHSHIGSGHAHNFVTGAGPDAARTRLKVVFGKTGTHSHAALAKLLTELGFVLGGG